MRMRMRSSITCTLRNRNIKVVVLFTVIQVIKTGSFKWPLHGQNYMLGILSALRWMHVDGRRCNMTTKHFLRRASRVRCETLACFGREFCRWQPISLSSNSLVVLMVTNFYLSKIVKQSSRQVSGAIPGVLGMLYEILTCAISLYTNTALLWPNR